MEGDESVLAEYEQWEKRMATHPEYLAERAADVAAFFATHKAANAAALDTTRRFLPPNIWTTNHASFAQAAFFLPDKLVKHLWENKVLWWTRLDPKEIAKIHVADLRSK
jgi:predicted lipoprotein